MVSFPRDCVGWTFDCGLLFSMMLTVTDDPLPTVQRIVLFGWDAWNSA
jgi:hypothetical protein